MPYRAQFGGRVLVLLLVVCGLLPLRVAGQSAKPDLSSLPLAFEENAGQAPDEFRYVARRGSMQTLFAEDHVDVVLAENGKAAQVVELRWSGATGEAKLEGEERLPGHSNYLRGNDEAKWIRNIPQFARVRYSEIYPNIDLVFHGQKSTLEHDFVVGPGADVSKIALQMDKRGRIDGAGNWVLKLGTSEFRLLRPVAYQMKGEVRTEVAANFVRGRGGEMRFRVGAYDHTRELVIDPVFVFSTYLDGTAGGSTIQAVTTDAQGNIYVTGSTQSADYPITNSGKPLCAQCGDVSNAAEGFISKLDPTGHTLLFSTYLGGTTSNASSGTFPSGIGIDATGNIYVAGTSLASDFPVAGSLQPVTQRLNAPIFFVSSIKPDGSGFNYSGLVGGEESSYSTFAKLAVDASGNAYLSGSTDDANFQLTPGAYNTTPTSYPNVTAFVLKLNASGKLVYSTLIPGNATLQPGSVYANSFPATGIHVDGNGQVTIAGNGGIGLPTTPGALLASLPTATNNPDPLGAFILQLNASGSALNFATYLPGVDLAYGLTADAQNNFYVVGNTGSALPVSANAYQTQNSSSSGGYVLKLDAQAKKVLAATYIAGASGSSFSSVGIDSKGNVAIGGIAFGADFPMANPFVTQYEITGWTADLVLAEISADFKTLLFGSYLSSTNAQVAYAGSSFSGLAVDASDKLIVIGTTDAQDFPTTAGSYQSSAPPNQNPQQFASHNFVAKLDLGTAGPSVCVPGNSVTLGTVLVGTSAVVNMPVTNCGNAPLQISSVVSSVGSVVPGQGCSVVAAGSTCNLPLTFTPADGSSVSGTLTITDNAAIKQQTVYFNGKGGVPSVFIPNIFPVSDLLVGTRGTNEIDFQNSGDGAWVVSNATITGEFSIGTNTCLAGQSRNAYLCYITINFAPTEAGAHAGTLTLTDNMAGSPHIIQLTGNGLSIYPTPSIQGVSGAAMDNPTAFVQVVGNNFFPASQVVVNGTARKTYYYTEALLTADLTASDLAQAGELSVTVTNPSPGGGTSNSFTTAVYNAIRNINFLHSVYDAKSGHIFASVSATSTNYANQVVVIDPTTAKVLSAWNVGNGPDPLAISGDGQFLYVGLDQDHTVAQVALPGGTVNFAVGLGGDPMPQYSNVARALQVLPGQPNSWAVDVQPGQTVSGGNGVAVFDDATERPTTTLGAIEIPSALLFVGSNATTLYGANLSLAPTEFDVFTINASGVTPTQTVSGVVHNLVVGETLDTDGTFIYFSDGEVLNPATLTLSSAAFSIPDASFTSPAMRVDVPSSRIYFALGESFGSVLPGTSLIQAYDLQSQQPVGAIGVWEFVNATPEMYRFGGNGLEVGAGNAMLFFQSSITSKTVPATQFSVTSVTPLVIPAGSTDQSIVIAGTGLGAGDTVSANGTALVTSGATATQITATVPASFLSVAGDVQLTIADTNNHTAYLELVVSPGNSAVGLSSNVVNFPAQNVGTSSATQTITLTNTGSAALVVSGVAVTGDFLQTNNCSTIAANGTCTLTVTFTPTAAGNRSGTLVISDSDATKTQTVTLSGIGSGVQIAATGTGGASVTVAEGTSANYGLTITPQGGFTGTLTFACSNVPQYAACLFNPPSATMGQSAVPVSVTITTKQIDTPSAMYRKHSLAEPMTGVLVCVLLVPLGIRKYRGALRRSVVLGLVLVAMGLVAMSGCGGGGSGSGGGGGGGSTTLYTAPGTYTVTVTASSGGFSQSTQLTLVVTN